MDEYLKTLLEQIRCKKARPYIRQELQDHIEDQIAAGTVVDFPKSVMSSGRTLAVHMYNLASEGLYMDQAYATAVILLVLVVGINTLSGVVARKLTKA